MKTGVVIVSITISIISILFSLGVIAYYMFFSKRVNISKIPVVKGNFSVLSAKESSSVKNECGNNDSQICSFTALNLQRAIDYCNIYSCNTFSYDGSTVKILEDAPIITNNETSSIYYRNVSI